jgi:multiple sugar transport system permease protein
VIFFNLVLETIHSFQIFTSAYVIGGGQGGPVDATKVYTLLLYLEGFGESHIGYASALAWVFLAAIGLLTLVFFRTGRFWVHYSDGEER